MTEEAQNDQTANPLGDIGFDGYGRMSMTGSSPAQTSVETDRFIEGMSGQKLNIGRITSSDGKTYFDLDAGKLVINDGTTDRVIIGKF